jgi:hypothetical protein
MGGVDLMLQTDNPIRCDIPTNEAMTYILDQNCDYRALLFARRAALNSNTDAALEAAKEALKARYKRNEQFDVGNLNVVTVEPYLNDVRDEIKIRVNGITSHIFEIGGLLCLAERLLPQGEWSQWVEQIPMKLRSAHNYKNVYHGCFGRPEALAWLKPTALYVVCSRKYPQELREFILENAEGIHPASTEELILVGELVRRGEIQVDDEKVLNLVRSRRKGDYVKRVQWHLQGIIRKINSTIDVLKVIHFEKRPEPMLPFNEKNTHPVRAAIRFLQGLQLTIKKTSDAYEETDDDGDMQPLQICIGCIYRDDALIDQNLDYRERHPGDPTIDDAAQDLARIDAEAAVQDNPTLLNDRRCIH